MPDPTSIVKVEKSAGGTENFRAKHPGETFGAKVNGNGDLIVYHSYPESREHVVVIYAKGTWLRADQGFEYTP